MKEIKFCPKCGTPIKEDSLFCENCGFALSKGEGKIKDLIEKLQRGELTPKEALKKLEERRLTEGTWGKKGSWVFDVVLWIAYFVLWLPLNFKFSAQLPAINFPAIVIYISLALVVIGTFFLVWAMRSHRKRGGLKKADETIIFYREGPFQIMRHPEVFGSMMWMYLLPIILSSKVPFTPLSVVAIIVMIIYSYYGTCAEEKLDIEKWGDEYRQYMKEVPRFNFLKGLWNLRKKRKKNGNI